MGASEQVFKLFQYQRELRFAEIQHATGLRSNLLAYTLGALVKRGVVQKEGERYRLSAKAETRIPYVHHDNAISPLPVVLVRCVNSAGNVLLIKRMKRPYDGLWSMPGGRMLAGESIEHAATRILKEKTFLDCTTRGVRALCNERVIDGDKTKHAFLLLVVDAEATSTIVEKSTVAWIAPKHAEASAIIPSDYFFLNAEPGVYECALTPRDEHEYDAVITPSASELFTKH